jgi:hypothetical protein
MVSFEVLLLIGVLAGILVLQPLIALVWVYVVYRVAVKFTRKQAEKAVDGRIDRVAAHVQNIAGGAE